MDNHPTEAAFWLAAMRAALYDAGTHSRQRVKGAAAMQPSYFTSTIQERLAWPITPDLYEKIRRLWIRHSIAEDKRDLDGLIATLAPNCVYEIVPTGQRWEGHDGARAFYTELLGAFPDVHFDLQDITIGPQGAIEIANVTGTQQGTWAGIAPTGKAVKFQVIIYFPWEPAAQLFAGEKVWVDLTVLRQFGE
jgi:predicted ester cyclase